MSDQPLQVVQLTPPGRGAIATLLIEGPGAWKAVENPFRCGSGAALASRCTEGLVFGRFGTEPGEEVVLRRRSDESIEICCHGGDAAVARIVELLVEQGCSLVDWSRWSLGHHEDPITAAAQLALAEARTERTAAILLDQYSGALRQALQQVQTALLNHDAVSASRQLEILLSRGDLGRHLVRPWRVVLAGQPNVGKSSLINALLGYPRTIVHHRPGTTRDVVTATTAVHGWPVELCDTAGLHEADHPLEQAGVELARRQLAAADLVVLVFDSSRAWSEADAALADRWPGALLVHHKSDLAPAFQPSASGVLATSALSGQGIDRLVEAIAGRLVPCPPPPGAPVPFTDEQIARLQSAVEAVARGDLPAARAIVGRI